MNLGRLLFLALLLSFVSAAGYAQDSDPKAPDEDRVASIGIGAHLVSSIDEVCERHGDAESCKAFSPFAGADITGHYWLLDWLGVGARISGSKDLDASETISSAGESEDRDQMLWRFAAELRIDPPILPSGMWLGAELGAAVMVDSLDEFDANDSKISSNSATQSALLLGAALGWDFLRVGHHFMLGLDARAEWIAFGDEAPKLKTDVDAQAFGSVLWVALGARVTYQW